MPGTLVYPYRGSGLIKLYPEMLQAWRRAGGKGPAKIQIDKTEQMPQPQGSTQECVFASGRIDLDGKGMQAMSEMMRAMKPLNFGGYSVTRYMSLAPTDNLFAKDEGMRKAMFATFKVNPEVMNQQNAAMMRQKQASDANIIAAGNAEVARRKAASRTSRP